MIKEIIAYALAFIILHYLIYFGQTEVFELFGSKPRFNYWNTTAFFSGISLLICIVLRIMSNFESMKAKIGYIYLTTLILKAGLFFIVFKDSVLSLKEFNTSERSSLLISLLIFLVMEVFIVAKILRENNPKI